MAALVRDRLGAPGSPPTATTARACARSRCGPATCGSTYRRSRARRAAAATAPPPGFSTSLSWDELVAFLREQLAAQLREPPGERVSDSPAERRAAARVTSPPGSPRTTSSRRRAARLGRGVKVGHAGTLDPFATGLLLVLVGRATRIQRFVMALPKRYEVTARFGAVSTTGDPEGEITVDRQRPRRRSDAADRRDPPAPAGVLGGQDRRPARLQARAGGGDVRDPRARGDRVPLRGDAPRRAPSATS